MASQVNHFKEFETVAQYEAYIQPDDYAKPLVALVDETDTVMFPQGGGGGDCGNPIMKSVDVEDYSGGASFSGFGQITDVTFPSGITSLANNALFLCTGLTSVDIPSGVTSIGQQAFDGCTSLASVTVPSTVTSIGNYAFRGDSSLTGIDLSGTSVTTTGNYTFQKCSSFASVSLPSGLTTIGQQAFDGCRALTSITLPSTVTVIGSSAFQNCSSLLSFTCLATTPPTLGTNALLNTPANMVIYVPSESVETYKIRGGWLNYESQIQAIPATP